MNPIIADRCTLGYLPLQHHDERYDLGLRQVLFACRSKGLGPSFKQELDDESVGDLLGGLLWPFAASPPAYQGSGLASLVRSTKSSEETSPAVAQAKSALPVALSVNATRGRPLAKIPVPRSTVGPGSSPAKLQTTSKILSREIPGWAFAWPSVVSAPIGGGLLVPGHGTTLPLNDATFTPDVRFNDLEVWSPFPQPIGAVGVVLAGTDEHAQSNLFTGGVGPIVSSSQLSSLNLSSRVYDLNEKQALDSTRVAPMHRALRVVPVAESIFGSGETLATVYTSPIGDFPNSGGGLIVDFGWPNRGGDPPSESGEFAERTPDSPTIGVGKPGKGTFQIGAVAGGFAGNEPSTGRTQTRPSPGTPKTQTRPSDRPGPTQQREFVFASLSHQHGGPIAVGWLEDLHPIGSTRDGQPINSAHISTRALFTGNEHPTYKDGPLAFEPEPWYPRAGGPLTSPVHLRWDQPSRRWRWEAEILWSTEMHPPTIKEPPSSIPPNLPPVRIPLPLRYTWTVNGPPGDFTGISPPTPRVPDYVTPGRRAVPQIPSGRFDAPPTVAEIEPRRGSPQDVFTVPAVVPSRPLHAGRKTVAEASGPDPRPAGPIVLNSEVFLLNPDFPAPRPVNLEPHETGGGQEVTTTSEVVLPGLALRPQPTSLATDLRWSQRRLTHSLLDHLARTSPTTARLESFGGQSAGEFAYTTRFPRLTGPGGIAVLPPEIDVLQVNAGKVPATYSNTLFAITDYARLHLGGWIPATGRAKSGFSFRNVGGGSSLVVDTLDGAGAVTGSTTLVPATGGGPWTEAAGVVSLATPTNRIELGTTTPQLRGPGTAAMEVTSGTPAAAAASQSGKSLSFYAGDAIAGTSTPGAAQGGSVVVWGGDAKRLTSGNARGGNVRLFGGAGIGAGLKGYVEIGASTSDRLSFFGVADVGQQTITGSRGGNAALASLLTALAATGLVVDGTVA